MRAGGSGGREEEDEDEEDDDEEEEPTRTRAPACVSLGARADDERSDRGGGNRERRDRGTGRTPPPGHRGAGTRGKGTPSGEG